MLSNYVTFAEIIIVFFIEFLAFLVGIIIVAVICYFHERIINQTNQLYPLFSSDIYSAQYSFIKQKKSFLKNFLCIVNQSKKSSQQRDYCISSKIKFYYWLIPLCSVVFTSLVLWMKLNHGALLFYLLLTWYSIAIFSIDWAVRLLPDIFTLSLLWLGLLFHVCYEKERLDAAVLGCIGGYLILQVIYWIYKWLRQREGMGYGDIKLMAAVGAWLGWEHLCLILFLATILALSITLVLFFLHKFKLRQTIPFGSYMIASAWYLFSFYHLPLITIN